MKITLRGPIAGSDKYHIDTLVVDENVGLAAGRDLYASARGTAIKTLKSIGPFEWAWIDLTIEGAPIWYHIYRDGGKFIKEEHNVNN